MELKDYWLLIKRNGKSFLIIWSLAVVLPIGVFFLKSKKYETVFSLNISRQERAASQDYQYDQYYRLLADEKFSEVVLLWLKDPATVAEVLEEAGIKKQDFSRKELEGFFQGKKLSASYSQVTFFGFDPSAAEKIVEVWQETLDEKTRNLAEKESGKGDWFLVELGEPVTGFYRPNYPLILLVSLLVGLPLAVFAVMFVDYFKKENADRN